MIDDRLAAAFGRHDAMAVSAVLRDHPELRDQINAPEFGFDSPAIVSYANDARMVEVLLEYGADPNQKSNWWAGGFHPLYVATGAAADLLLAAGSLPDACAAAHLDRADLLTRMLELDPSRAHEHGGARKSGGGGSQVRGIF